MFIERIKSSAYYKKYVNYYFWRTYDKQEIDLIEEEAGQLFTYELKWKKNKVKIPKAWREAYPDSKFEVISPENYSRFTHAD